MKKINNDRQEEGRKEGRKGETENKKWQDTYACIALVLTQAG